MRAELLVELIEHLARYEECVAQRRRNELGHHRRLVGEAVGEEVIAGVQRPASLLSVLDTVKRAAKERLQTVHFAIFHDGARGGGDARHEAVALRRPWMCP